MEDRILNRGLTAIHQQRYSVAATLFKTLLDTYPDSASDSKVQAALNECSQNPECAWEWEHKKNCPPDGCVIFFPDYQPSTPSSSSREKDLANY